MKEAQIYYTISAGQGFTVKKKKWNKNILMMKIL
jgi:hypothetical protein